MDTITFINALKKYFDKDIEADMAKFYHARINGFSSGALKDIFNRIVETQRTFPRIATVLSIADELGFKKAPPPKKKTADGTKKTVDCPECNGTGLVKTISTFSGSDTNGRIYTPAYKGPSNVPTCDWIGRMLGTGKIQYEEIYRCHCPAGTVYPYIAKIPYNFLGGYALPENPPF